MLKEMKTCPVCHETHILLGEGSYGKSKNDQFLVEDKVNGCNTISCDDYHLEHDKDRLLAED